MRRVILILFLLPALVLLTGLACDLPFGSEDGSISLPDVDLDKIRDTVAQGKYLVELTRQLTTMTRSGDNLESLLLAPEMGNVRWTGSVRAQVAVVRLVCQQLDGITPPENLTDIHAAVMDVCGDCRRTIDIVLDGIDGLDPSAINRAVTSGQGCLNGLQENRAALDELRQQLDLGDIDLEGLEVGGFNLGDLPGVGNLDLSSLEELDLPAPASPTVNTGSNLRAGPGTGFERVGGLQAGTIVAVVGRNQAGDWLAIELEGLGQTWIAASLVDDAPDADSLPILPAP